MDALQWPSKRTFDDMQSPAAATLVYYGSVEGLVHVSFHLHERESFLNCYAQDVSNQYRPVASEAHPDIFPFHMVVSVLCAKQVQDVCRLLRSIVRDICSAHAHQECCMFFTCPPVDSRTRVRAHWPRLLVDGAAAAHMYEYVMCVARAARPEQMAEASPAATQYFTPLPLIYSPCSVRGCLCPKTQRRDCTRCNQSGLLVMATDYTFYTAYPSAELAAPGYAANHPCSLASVAAILDATSAVPSKRYKCAVVQLDALAMQPMMPVVGTSSCIHCGIVPSAAGLKCPTCNKPRLKPTHRMPPVLADILPLVKGSDHAERITNEDTLRIASLNVKAFLACFSSATYKKWGLSQKKRVVLTVDCTRNLWKYASVKELYFYKRNGTHLAVLSGLGSCFCPIAGSCHPDRPSMVCITSTGGWYCCGNPQCKSTSIAPVEGYTRELGSHKIPGFRRMVHTSASSHTSICDTRLSIDDAGDKIFATDFFEQLERSQLAS